MRICYDGAIYGFQATGGINRYFANLISRLPESFTPTLTTCCDREVNYPKRQNLTVVKYSKPRYLPSRISYWLEKYYFRAVNCLTEFDIVHPTYYSFLTQQEVIKYSRPVVINVWDMIHEFFPKQLDPDGKFAQKKRKAIQSAQAVICISENTKKDLLEHYSLSEAKVSVTPLASEIDISLSYGPEPVPARAYYLYVGTRISYKNFDFLLSAFAKVVSVRPDLAICVVGSAFNETEKKFIANLNLSDRIENIGYASDAHLAKLYRCSIALVYPSLYEGFGIPPLEAMSCGTVVVASNCSSIPEVVSDAGLLFNPKLVWELADILLFLLDNPTERDRLIAKGYQQAKAFSWDKTVSQTLDIYRTIA